MVSAGVSMTVLKVKYGDDMRKTVIRHNNDLTMNDLIQKVQQIFKIQPHDPLVLKYKDADGDLITLADDSDLNLALNYEALTVEVLGESASLEISKDNLAQIQTSIDRLTNSIAALESSHKQVYHNHGGAHAVHNNVVDGEIPLGAEAAYMISHPTNQFAHPSSMAASGMYYNQPYHGYSGLQPLHNLSVFGTGMPWRAKAASVASDTSSQFSDPSLTAALESCHKRLYDGRSGPDVVHNDDVVKEEMPLGAAGVTSYSSNQLAPQMDGLMSQGQPWYNQGTLSYNQPPPTSFSSFPTTIPPPPPPISATAPLVPQHVNASPFGFGSGWNLPQYREPASLFGQTQVPPPLGPAQVCSAGQYSFQQVPPLAPGPLRPNFPPMGAAGGPLPMMGGPGGMLGVNSFARGPVPPQPNYRQPPYQH